METKSPEARFLGYVEETAASAERDYDACRRQASASVLEAPAHADADLRRACIATGQHWFYQMVILPPLRAGRENGQGDAAIVAAIRKEVERETNRLLQETTANQCSCAVSAALMQAHAEGRAKGLRDVRELLDVLVKKAG